MYSIIKNGYIKEHGLSKEQALERLAIMVDDHAISTSHYISGDNHTITDPDSGDVLFRQGDESAKIGDAHFEIIQDSSTSMYTNIMDAFYSNKSRGIGMIWSMNKGELLLMIDHIERELLPSVAGTVTSNAAGLFLNICLAKLRLFNGEIMDIDTGGGCEAYQKETSFGTVLITKEAGLPEEWADVVSIVFYDKDDNVLGHIENKKFIDALMMDFEKELSNAVPN